MNTRNLIPVLLISWMVASTMPLSLTAAAADISITAKGATKDSINKSYTAATVVIAGRRPGQSGSRATFWIRPGEPVTGVALPLWVEAGRVPEALWAGKDAPLWHETLRIKNLGRPYQDKERQEYLNLSRLANAEGTGYLPGLQALEKEIFAATAAFAPESRTPAELAAFQDAMAARALAALKAVGP